MIYVRILQRPKYFDAAEEVLIQGNAYQQTPMLVGSCINVDSLYVGCKYTHQGPKLEAAVGTLSQGLKSQQLLHLA